MNYFGVSSPAEPENVDTTPPVANPENPTTPQVYKRQYLTNTGPIESQMRIIDPSVVDGYESCDELRNDILNAVKWLANSIIVQESVYNEWYVIDS